MADVLGVAGYALGVFDFFKVAASGGSVRPQVVGGDLVGKGLVFGLVVEDGGLKVKA